MGEMSEKKQCLECGRWFTPGKPDQKFDSALCKMRWMNADRAKRGVEAPHLRVGAPTLWKK